MKHRISKKHIFDQHNTWFISDVHFGHENVLKFEEGYHSFSSIEDHDNTIVANWFSLVYPEDTIFFLGDAAMPRTHLSYLIEMFKQLPGKIIWLKGNHDRHIDSNWLYQLRQVCDIVEFTAEPKEIFVTCEEKTRFSQDGQNLRRLILFHYPIAEHDGTFKDTFHIYGHVHEKVYPIKNAYPVSACLADYKPVNYAWIKAKITQHNERLDRPGQPRFQPTNG